MIKYLPRILLVTGLILLLPLIAMQFTDEVNWNLSDFLIAGVLLFSSGFIYELAAKKTGNTAYKFAVGLAIGTAVLLFWVNAAVGIIGNENNEVNLMFVVVLIIVSIGSILVRFQPGGMARIMLATAAAQALVGIIALLGDWGSTAPIWPLDVLLLTLFFTSLWFASACLFRIAGREQPSIQVKPED